MRLNKKPWPYRTVNCWKADHAVLALYAKSLNLSMAALMHRFAEEALNGGTAKR